MGIMILILNVFLGLAQVRFVWKHTVTSAMLCKGKKYKKQKQNNPVTLALLEQL